MRRYTAGDADAPTLVLGHGAGAGHDHPWIRRVAQELADRGVHVVTFNFPYKDRGRGAPDPPVVLEDAFADVWQEAAASARGPMFAGGKSMGGRIASQIAARDGLTPAPAGLVFFGYPLHPPAKPAQRRDRHLPRITVSMLFLHGSRDGFGTPDEMRALADSLPGATLEIVDGGDHSLVAGKRLDPDGQLLTRAVERAAGWMRAVGRAAPRPDSAS